MINSLKTFLSFGLLLALYLTILPGSLTAGERPGKHPGAQVTTSPATNSSFTSGVILPKKASETQYRLVSLQGELVTTFSAPAGQGRRIILSMDLDNLPQGPYLLIEHDGSRRESSSVIIVGP
jgi:hypothetical protein